MALPSTKVLIALVSLVLFSCAAVEKKAPEVTREPGFIKGLLQIDNTLNVSLEGGKVRSGDMEVPVDGGGRFAMPRLAAGKHYLVAEKRFAEGPVRRVLGVAIIYVSDFPIEFKMRVRDASDVDAFCSDCHPTIRNATRRDQIVRDVHPSGIFPKKANKSSGQFDEKGKVTCESCHTVHKPTGYPHFTLASYTNGILCNQCH